MNVSRKMLIVILLLTLPVLSVSAHRQKTTVPIKLRIQYLKRQVQANFRNVHLREGDRNLENDDQRLLDNEQYDYVNEKSLPITPEGDGTGNFVTRSDFIPRFNTQFEPVKETTSVLAVDMKPPERSDQRFTIKSELSGFFRRTYCDLKWPAAAWMHCQDLITPFLKGIRTNITITKTLQLMTNDRTIIRFFNMIRVNVTDLDEEDHAGILQQMSLEQVRLFSWSSNAIKLLLDIFVKGRRHTFANVKAGVKKWMKTYVKHPPAPEELLKHTKLFRPPCVTTATLEGPTKSAHDHKYEKPTTGKKRCRVTLPDGRCA